MKMKRAFIRSVKVFNVSLASSEQDLHEFFLFSGEIVHVEIQSCSDSSLFFLKYLYSILVADAYPDIGTENQDSENAESAVQKAEDVVSTMLAKGFILGKDAVGKTKAFDEKHQFTSPPEMDQKYQVSEKARSALTVAEQKVSTAGCREVGQKTREKVLAEEEAQKTEEKMYKLMNVDLSWMLNMLQRRNHPSPHQKRSKTREGNAEINVPVSLKPVEPAAVEQPPKAYSE
ncbi:hypothetical protein F3Y22_tig00111105pilonHSYRG00276 [Hibiscus syriacus]|uniref:Uncharacterized protein n=1 Tax=Hibiscus syriacus TaxID=106335 RepID=A0A6A2YZ75_HIBSY|nr:hypothetical protein F3Y22_tig00111105pilonHSYRG00276 [Hibiscus syriacus]